MAEADGDLEEESGSEVLEEEEGAYKPKVRWTIPQLLKQMTFVGKDVLAIGHDLYVTFFNFKSNTESVYVANSEHKGDGVDCIAGHRSNVFAFAEKRTHARIFLVSYPTFEILNILQDSVINRYKGICMMEADLICGFSGFPNYVMSLWSWRNGQRLLDVPTDVIRRDQIYMSSRTHMLVCECWGEGLIVWEVAQCYKKCLVMKRVKEEKTGWEVSEPKLVGVCWANEGQLYAIDGSANLYNIRSDGIKLLAELEWSDNLTGQHAPCVCTFGNGILVYGPDDTLRALKKAEQSWKVAFTYKPLDTIRRLVSNATCDVGVMWGSRGLVYKITGESEDKIDVQIVTYKQRDVKRIQLIAPDFEYVAMLDDTGCLCVYNVKSFQLVTMKYVDASDVSFQASPADPLLVIFGEVGTNYGIVLVTFNPPLPDTASTLTVEAEGLEKTPDGVKGISEDAPETAEGPPKPAGLHTLRSYALTNQIVSRVTFSADGRHMTAAAMAAGHLFIFHIDEDYKPTLIRYTELGRGLADSILMPVGGSVRSFSLVLFSDKYAIGERIVCINAETGKDNKFAGKMAGPYAQLLPLATPDTMLAVPHLSKQFHVLKLTGDKGVTVLVKMGPIVESGHDIRYFFGFFTPSALLTYGYDGTIVLRKPDAPHDYGLRHGGEVWITVRPTFHTSMTKAFGKVETIVGTVGDKPKLKIPVVHRYQYGVRQAIVDEGVQCAVTLGAGRDVTALWLGAGHAGLDAVCLRPPDLRALYVPSNTLRIIHRGQKNYLDLQEDKKVHEETIDYKEQRDEVVKSFEVIQARLVALLEENINEVPLHQLSLSEFNLHMENKKERYKQAEKEREEIRLTTEALIRAQDKVTAWIKKTCWDTMLTPRVKLFAIFSHYQVENYAVLPCQRDNWPELLQVEALRAVEMENDEDLFRPWLEYVEPAERSSQPALAASVPAMSSISMRSQLKSMESQPALSVSEETVEGEPAILSGTYTYKFVTVPPAMVPQTLAFSFLQMNWLSELVRLNVQNMRLWFNKQFDELMVMKKREVGLVIDRNDRLRFIISELNKLSDLRGSFHHLMIEIHDPVWRQEEEPVKLIKVVPEECEIEPYISPSQIVVIPPDPGPKDDFRERALMDMMDGVLEKLWHEEIKKPVPKPQCMLDKDPEAFNEDDLRLVFEYEAKVRFRNEERDKYRKMLHAEYGKLSAVLDEGIVKFNAKVKELWLTKLRVDGVIGQENLNLMRLRRVNLDRVEAGEKIELMRLEIAKYTNEVEILTEELQLIQQQSMECAAVQESLAAKDRSMERSFKNNFADLSPIVIDQCIKYYRKRPKWQARATFVPAVLCELAAAVLSGVKPATLHPDCYDFYKGVDQLDQISNMPPVLDAMIWATLIRLRRAKIENEIRMRALALDTAYVESAVNVWTKAIQARRAALSVLNNDITTHREMVELAARNKTIQLVVPAGQVEIVTTGHMEDFEDATLMPRADIDVINNLILKVGQMKLNMMRKQMGFRRVILAKEWEHAQMKMKLRHMEQELYSYRRLKIPKELQLYLKNKELGYTDEMDYVRMEKEVEATRQAVNKLLTEHIHQYEELELRSKQMEAAASRLEDQITTLNMQVSEKRLNEDPFLPIRIRRIYKKRMEVLVLRSLLIREVQANHTQIVILQTQLELLRLKTYPTLASFRTM